MCYSLKSDTFIKIAGGMESLKKTALGMSAYTVDSPCNGIKLSPAAIY